MTHTSLLSWLRRSAPSKRRLFEAVLLSVAASVASLTLFGGSGLLIGKAAEGGNLATLGVLLVIIELVAFFRAPLRFEERVLTHRVALGSMVRWRAWLFEIFCRCTPGVLSLKGSGELLDSVIEDVDALDDLWVRVLLPLVGVVTTGVLGMIIALVLDPLAGLVIAVTLLLGLLIALGLASGTRAMASAEATARGEVAAATVDLLDGMVELDVTGTTPLAQRRVALAEGRRSALSGRLARRRALGISLEGLLVGLGVAGVTLCAGAAHHDGHLSSPAAFGLGLLGFAALEPLVLVSLAALRAGEVAAAAQRLDDLGDGAVAPAVGGVPWPTRPVLSLRGVTARPAPGARLVLHGVDLELLPGTRVAIVGSSGAGKSTLGAVLLGLLRTEQGSVRVGESALESIDPGSLHEHVALVDQSPELLSGSLADALRLGAPDATDAELVDVLRLVELDHLGLDRPIGERASNLSTGEARRVALARASLRSPDLLILDEPTAGLDEEQAHSVLSACLRAVPHATVLLLTHRGAEAALAEECFELQAGQLIKIA